LYIVYFLDIKIFDVNTVEMQRLTILYHPNNRFFFKITIDASIFVMIAVCYCDLYFFIVYFINEILFSLSSGCMLYVKLFKIITNILKVQFRKIKNYLIFHIHPHNLFAFIIHDSAIFINKKRLNSCLFKINK